MTKDEVIKILYDRYIKPTENKDGSFIGVEIELRRQLVCRVKPAYIDTDSLYTLAKQVIDLCRQGLIERGYGEEIYLAPLYKRIENRTNPALTMLNQLESGAHIDKIIKEYGSQACP